MSIVLAHLFAVVTNELHDDSLRDAGFFEEGDSGVAEGVEGEGAHSALFGVGGVLLRCRIGSDATLPQQACKLIR